VWHLDTGEKVRPEYTQTQRRMTQI
jgi:hypothetical protein